MSESGSTAAPAGTRPHVSSRPRIIVLGGGYVGLYTTMRLLRKLHRREADITVVDPRSYMTYQPFLPEASAGSLDARHVVVPLRKVLKGAEILNARVVSLDHSRRSSASRPSRARSTTCPTTSWSSRSARSPGRCPSRASVDEAVGFKTVEEAIYLRNQVLESPGHRRVDGRRGPAPARADVPVHRRRLRRCRGDGRAGGHGPVRDPLLLAGVPGGPAVRHGRGDRPHPARGRPGHGPVDGRAAAQARHRDAAQHPAGLLRRRARSSSPTGSGSSPTPSSGRPASRPARSSPTPTSRSTTRAG